ncbi:MAG: hypothetical protein FWG65_02310, partial [Turicibacter sp.]|nr:hypothetical protein [Turicibacter sp.]
RYTNISKSLLEYYDVRKSIGDVSKLLLKHTDEPNFAVPENQREKLQKHHSVRSGFIMGDVQIDFDNIEDFVKSNRAKLKYLSHIYGEKPITELESIISESFRSLEWGEIESILQYISDNAHGQNDINKVVRERIAVHAAELLSGKLDDVKVENRKLNAEKEELRGELETANEKKKELEGTINEYGTMLQAANDKKEELQSKVTDTEAKLSAAEKETEEKLSAAKKEVEELNKELKKANKNNPLRTLLSKIKIPLFQSKRKATEEIGNQPLINDEGDLERIEHDFGVAVTSSQDEGSSEVSQQHQDESFNGITGDDFDDSTDNIDIADNFTPSSQDSEDSSEANQPHQDEPSDEQSTGYSEQGFDGFNNDDVDDTDDNHNPLSQDSESSNEDNQPHQDESQSTKYAPSSFKDLDDVIRCYKDKSEGSNEDNQPSQDESQSTSDPEPSPSSQDFNPQDYSDWKEIIQRYQNELLNNQIIGYLEKYYDLHECDFGGFTKFILKFIEKDSDKIKKFLETQFPQKPTSKAAGILLMDLERDEYTREITILHNISIVEDYEEFKGKVAELGKIKKEKKLAAYHAIYKGMEKIIERETYKKFLESIPNIEIRRSSKKVIFASLRHSIWRRNIKKAITAFAPHIAWKHKIKIFSDHKKIKKIQNNAAKFGIKFEPDSSNTNPNPMSDESTQETNGISSTNKARTDVDYNTYKREEMTDEDSKKDKIPQGKRSKKRHWMYFMRMPHVSNKLFYGILAFFAVALVVIGVVSYLFS